MSDAPSLPDIAATLFDFASGTECLTVSVVIPQGEEVSAAIVSYDRVDAVLTVAEGDEVRNVPGLDGLGGTALGSIHTHRFPDFEVDEESGEITGAVGALEDLARSLEKLAQLFGPGALSSAEFRTKPPSEPLEIGSDGEGGFVVSCGETGFEVPENWPTR